MIQEKHLAFQDEKNREFPGINRAGQPRIRITEFCLMLARALVVTDCDSATQPHESVKDVHSMASADAFLEAQLMSLAAPRIPHWFAVAVFILVGFFAMPLPLTAQVTDGDVAGMIGEAIGAGLDQAIQGAQQMAQSAAQASREIEEARRAYWDAVRNGYDLEEARRTFAHQLQGKDFIYMWMAIPEGVEGPRYQTFERMSPVDGGIRPWARYEFSEWISAIRAHLGAHGDAFIIPSPAQVSEALEATKTRHAAYIRARDWAEIDDSGLVWPWDEDARAHAIMVLRRYTEAVTSEEAEEELARWIALFGEEQVLAAADRLRTARRDAMSNLANPQELGVSASQPHIAFRQLLQTEDAAATFKWYLWQSDFANRGKPIAQAAHEFERYVWAYGEDAVEAVGRDIARPGEYAFPPWVLRTRHPDSHVREAIALSPSVTTRGRVDELHQELLQRYDRERLQEAADAIRPRQWRYQDALQQGNLERLFERHDDDTLAMLLEVLEQGREAVLNAPPPMAANISLIYNPNPPPADGIVSMEDGESLATVRVADFAGTADGVIYGMTDAAGIFRINVDGSDFRVLHQFPYRKASDVRGKFTLRPGPDGFLYGAADVIGAFGQEELHEYRNHGMIFRLAPDGSGFEVLSNPLEYHIEFPELAGHRGPRLIMIDGAGNLIVQLSPFGAGNPVLASITPDGSEARLIYRFPGYPGSWNALVDGGDGFIYGFASINDPPGGAASRNEVFRVRHDGSEHEVIHQVELQDGRGVSHNGLTLGIDGRLYGSWGYRSDGRHVAVTSLFRLDRDGDGYVELHRSDGVRSESAYPAPLVQGSDGLLYTVVRRIVDDTDQERLIGIDTSGAVRVEFETPVPRTSYLVTHGGALFGLETPAHSYWGQREQVYPGSIYRVTKE